MIKKWSLRILWTAVGLIVACGWGEVITRAFYPQNVDTILDILRHDEVCGYIYQPNVSVAERGRGYDVPFETNSVGLREREIPRKRDDVLRILVIGNSFCVSHGVRVEKSFARAIEDALNRRADRFAGYSAVETINASNAGYNPYNYRMAYRRWAPEVQPDLVIVGFVADKEWQCDPQGTQYVVENGLLTGRFRPGQTPRRHGSNPLQSVRKSLARNSHFYVLLRNFLYYNEKIDRLLKRGDGEDTAVRSLRPYLVPTPEAVDRGWQRTFDHMKALRDEVRAAGGELLIASIPEMTEIDPAYRTTLREQADLAPDRIDVQLPQRRLREFCSDVGIALADMGPAVEAAHDTGRAYLFDNHWNARGIAAGAEAVAERLQALTLPPFVADPTP